ASLETPSVVHSGRTIVIHSWWQREGTGNADARVSIRLVGPDDHVYAQTDQPPTGWYYYPHEWPDHTPILGRYEIAIPTNTPASLMVKLFVYNAEGGMASVEVSLGTVTIG